MITYSEEQENIINNISSNNISVDAIAGSGKTTTILGIAKRYDNKTILVLTYNKKLQYETQEKINMNDIDNIRIYTYHSYGRNYYLNPCKDDSDILQIVKDNKPIKNKYQFDIIIVDEIQDMTNIYYKFVLKIIKDTNLNSTICILGDFYQNIYVHKSADNRYLTYGHKLFNYNSKDWVSCNLRQSFRLTNKIAQFINNCMLGEERIIAHKKSDIKPTYIICDIYHIYDKLISYILRYNPDDIFILAPSIKKSTVSKETPLRTFENMLKIKNPNINIFIPDGDDDKIDDKVIKNKLVFSTFHQSKGLERKLCIVWSFDDSYFDFFNKKTKDARLICPNELYVATTRAKEELVLIHSHKQDYLPFINIPNLNKYANIINNISIKADKSSINKLDVKLDASSLIAHIPELELLELFNKLKITTIKQGKKSKIECITMNGDMGENVSAISGYAIPAYFEYTQTNNMEILNYCLNYLETNKSTKILTFLKKNKHDKKLKQIVKHKTIKENLLYIATFYNCIRSGYLSKFSQITDFNWIKSSEITKYIKNMNTLNISDGYYEYNLPKKQITQNKITYTISGIADYYSTNYIYEFKCVSDLKREHYLQLAVYMFMDTEYHKLKKYYLYNILNDELYEIEYDLEILKYIIDMLLKLKQVSNIKTNEKFIESNLTDYDSIFN
jgi:ATP:corrinoid adenosyltransferase